MTLGEEELKAIEKFWSDPAVTAEAVEALADVTFLPDDVNFIKKSDNMIVKVSFFCS